MTVGDTLFLLSFLLQGAVLLVVTSFAAVTMFKFALSMPPPPVKSGGGFRPPPGLRVDMRPSGTANGQTSFFWAEAECGSTSIPSAQASGSSSPLVRRKRN